MSSDTDKVNRSKNERGNGKAKGRPQKKENNNKEKITRVVADASVTADDGDVKGDVIELNARTLARDCLKELGREMGVSN